jgi:hypothetical protein
MKDKTWLSVALVLEVDTSSSDAGDWEVARVWPERGDVLKEASPAGSAVEGAIASMVNIALMHAGSGQQAAAALCHLDSAVVEELLEGLREQASEQKGDRDED